MSSLWAIENETLKLRPHIGQARAWRSDRRFVFMLSGTQSGKTSFLPWWLKREIDNLGAGDYLAVTATYDLFKLKFLPAIREVFETIFKIGRYWAGDKILELRNPKTGKFDAKNSSDPMWGRIILRSAESKGGLESATAKAAILDEIGQDTFGLDDWEAVLRRLSLTQGRVLAGTTLYNMGWLKSQIYDAWKAGDKSIDVFQFPSTANPAFPKAEFERALAKMQGWRFEMFYRGQFAKPAGLIYQDYDDVSMLVDDFEIPADWPRVAGVDFGGANTATLHLSEGPDVLGRVPKAWYACIETLSGGRSTQDHVEQQKKLLGNASSYEFTGGAKSETQQRMDWLEAGLRVVEPFIWDVEGGIDRVTRLIKEDRFRVFRSLAGLRDELGRYQRKVDELGNPTDDILNKRFFHRLDALRYAAIQIIEGSMEVEIVNMGQAMAEAMKQ